MRLEKEATIRAAPSDVWARLWDVKRLIHYIPSVEEVKSVEEGKRYSVRVSDRVGPIQIHFDLDVVVDGLDQDRFLRVKVSGRAKGLASSLRQVLEIRLEEAPPDGTRLALSTEISILGKLGSLGDGLIRNKATEVFANFVGNLKKDLESDEIE